MPIRSLGRAVPPLIGIRGMHMFAAKQFKCKCFNLECVNEAAGAHYPHVGRALVSPVHRLCTYLAPEPDPWAYGTKTGKHRAW